MSLEVWMSFMAAAMLLCFTPGPTVLLVMGQALRHGKKSVLPLVSGVLLGDLIAMTLSLLGVGVLLEASASLFYLLKWIGAAYLVYLGVKSLRSKGTALADDNNDAKGPAQPMASGVVFRHSLLVTSLNPKGIIFFMAFFPLFIDPHRAYVPQLLVLGVSFLAVSAASASTYSLFSGYLRSKVTSASFQNRFNKVSGGMLVSAGALTATIQQ